MVTSSWECFVIDPKHGKNSCVQSVFKQRRSAHGFLFKRRSQEYATHFLMKRLPKVARGGPK